MEPSPTQAPPLEPAATATTSASASALEAEATAGATPPALEALPTTATSQPALDELAAAALAQPLSPPPNDAIRALDELFAERGDDPIGGMDEPVEPSAESVDVPSRAETAAALARVTSSVRACAADQAGAIVEVRFVFASNGRVTTAQVEGRSSRLTPQQRSCIARAARRAEIASFARPRFEVTYPFRF